MTDPKPAKPSAAKPETASKTPASKPRTKTSAVPPVEPAPAVVATAASTASMAPAGWYPIAGSRQQRWWDGSAWTEHVYDPATALPAAADIRHLRAPEGTSSSTIWMWLTAVSPVIAIAGYIPTALSLTPYENVDFATGAGVNQFFGISFLLDAVLLVACILFPILDWRALGKRGVPRPFHWAWSLPAIILSTPAIYVIGRTVVARRRTGTGLAPLWVFIALQVIAWIIGAVVSIVFISELVTQFTNLLNDANDVF